jgi:hypothetical protein
LIALAIFAVQMVCSAWWMARFRFGPMEWLWRMLTYGKAPAMLAAAASPPAGTPRAELGPDRADHPYRERNDFKAGKGEVSLTAPGNGEASNLVRHEEVASMK